MFTTKFQTPLRWSLLTVILMFAAGFVAIAIEKPTGSIAGKIDMETPGFHLSTYDIRSHKVFALAVGPRGGNIVERGAWVKPDGSFQISQLPVGEYELRLRASGFSTASQEGVFVDEAKISRVPKPIHLAILEPSLNIASNTRVFTPKETPHFWINATGSERATVRLYHRDILALMRQKQPQGMEFSSDLSLYKPYQENDHRLFEKEKPLQTLTRKLTPDSEDWAHAEFKLNNPLPTGEYMVVAEVASVNHKTAWNVMWFSVSKLGLIVKQAPEQTLVRAINLETLQPWPQVNVQLQSKDHPERSPLASGITGADGFAHFPGIVQAKDSSLLALGQQGADRAFGGMEVWNNSNLTYQTYFYTERPIYRLGQTVYFKGVTRLQTPDGWKTPNAGLPVKILVEDPDNTPLWEGKLTANAFGSFNGIYTIPAAAKTGAYQVTLTYPDQSTSYHRFEVAQYRKPEYQVDVMPLQSRIIAGSKAKARIRATYYFGAPVTNARIKYSIYADTDWSGRNQLMPRPDYYAYFDDWAEEGEGEGYVDSHYAGAFISEGYAQTDETGEALIEYDTLPVKLDPSQPYGSDYQDKRYTVQAEVTDLSRIAVIGSGTQNVAAGDFTLFVTPQREVTLAGEPVRAWVRTVDYQGKPVPHKTVNVTLTRWNWDSLKLEYRGSTVAANTTVTTDAQGKASVNLPTNDHYFTDNYFLSAQTQDDQGHALYDQSNVWVASRNFPYVREGQAAQQEAFSVKPDKKIYQPGEMAKIMITAPLSGKEHSDLIVAIEGNKLHEVRSLPMDATAKLVEIPIKAGYAPNIYVTATLVGPKRQFYNQSTLLKVSPEAHFLHVSIKTDKPKYKPGETATYTIIATHANGKPAPRTELSLGVVDESIYAIRPEAATDIRKFFYARIENAVSTFSSFPEDYSGGPDKIEPRVRKDFRDMAAWLPNLTTDAHGVATALVKLPDNLTTWRATVRGITQATDAGSAVAKVVATQELIVRLALPRFYTQYDEGVLSAIVHNYTDQPQQVHLSLTASPQFGIQQALSQELTIKPDGAARYDWHAQIRESGPGSLQVKAVGQTAADALVLQVPIRPLGVEITQAASGIMTQDPDALTVQYKIPSGTSPELAHVLLSVASSSLGPVLGSFNSLINYPYGCTEQTMSRLMPAVIAKSLSNNLGIPMDGMLNKKFEEVATQALARLKAYRHADGGWGWWQFDSSDPYLTAYVMEGFSALREAGYPMPSAALPPNWQAEGLAFLQKSAGKLTQQLSDPKIAAPRAEQLERQIDLAYMHYVLSRYNQKPTRVARQFWLAKTQMAPPEALAYLTMAFQRSKDSSAAQQSYAALNRLAEPTDAMISWDHTPRLLTLLQLKQDEYTYRFTGAETTALALRATLAMNGDQSANLNTADRLEAIERWLLLQRSPHGWENTKTTAAVLRAMMEKAVALNKPGESQFTVSSNLWATAKQFTKENLYAPEQSASSQLSQIPSHSLTLEKQGPGRLYYASLLTYPLGLKPGAVVPQIPMPQGLSIQRSFYRIQAEPVGPQGAMRLRTQLITNGTVHAGETVVMKVVVNTPVALPYAMLDIALPSGGEVISNDPRDSQLDQDVTNNDFQSDWANWWWSHQDILDDRVVMFASQVPVGKSEFHALVRLELPGRFQMNPVRLNGMYTQRIQAYSTLDSLEVVE
jgi:uncharacterized protein YfaS (alpha-2-macroglobulin family)